MWKKKLALALVLVFMFTCAGPSYAIIPPDILNQLRSSGKQSNNLITHSIIDLVYVSEGSVTTHTYKGDSEDLTINNFTVKSQSPTSASQKITPFVFELTNLYRPETNIAVTAAGPENTVHVYTYGKYKDNAMLAIISGLPDCLGNPPVHHDRNSRSWTGKYGPEVTTKEPVTSFAITTFRLNDLTYTVTNDASGKVETKKMDVKPILQNERIFIPIRYLTYALGASENDISWDNVNKTTTIKIKETTGVLKVGSTAMLINNTPVEMDAAPFIKMDRMFLAAKYAAEPFGAKITWNQDSQQVSIEFPQIQEQGL